MNQGKNNTQSPGRLSAYAGLAISLTVALMLSMNRQAGIMPTMIVGTAMMAAIVAWWFTTARFPANPKKVLPVFLVTTFLLMAHITEEYIWDFGPQIGELTGKPWSAGEFFVMFGVVVPVFWILCGALLYYRNPFGNWIIWFIYIGMIAGEPVHVLVFPFLKGGGYQYFPGMATALYPFVLGLWGMTQLYRGYKSDKAMAGAG